MEGGKTVSCRSGHPQVPGMLELKLGNRSGGGGVKVWESGSALPLPRVQTGEAPRREESGTGPGQRRPMACIPNINSGTWKNHPAHGSAGSLRVRTLHIVLSKAYQG